MQETTVGALTKGKKVRRHFLHASWMVGWVAGVGFAPSRPRCPGCFPRSFSLHKIPVLNPRPSLSAFPQGGFCGSARRLHPHVLIQARPWLHQ